MTNRSAIGWLVAGLLGLVLGAAGAIWDVVAFSITAGALALVAGVAAFRLVLLAHEQLREMRRLGARVDELEEHAEHEAAARAELEASVFAEEVKRTAVRRDTRPDGLVDPETGLSSEAYFLVALEARVAAARRQLEPLSVVLMEAVQDLNGSKPHRADPVPVAKVLRGSLRECDTVCRLASGAFALILEDTPENGAIWTVERARRSLVTEHDGVTVWAGISCYPAHGLDCPELLDRAEAALAAAREWRQDRIEVATPE